MKVRDNPYRPGSGTVPPLLAGRSKEIAAFEALLLGLRKGDHPRSILASGLRGVGKTVLLNHFEIRAQSVDCPASFLEVQSEAILANGLARKMSRMMSELKPIRKLRRSITSAFEGLAVFTLKEPGTGWEMSLSVKAPDAELLAEDFAELLIGLGTAASARGKGVVFLFDELHNANPKELGPFLTGLHRAAQKELPVAMVGAGLPNLSTTIAETREYAERMFSVSHIGPLRRDDAALALTSPAQRWGVDFDDRALKRVLGLTGGYPYFIQEYGSHLWECLDGDLITESEVEQAEPLARAALDRGFFQVRLDRATDDGRVYLRSMASLGEGPYRVRDVETTRGRRRQSETRKHLLGKGLIYEPEDGVMDYTVPQFGEFMIRRFPTG